MFRKRIRCALITWARRTITRPRLLAAFILLLAVALTWWRVPVASSQGLTLVAARVADELPLANPDADLWQQTTAIEVPLSAQNIARPILPETRVKAITARALYNDQQLAFLVEWADETENDQALRVEDFRDSVALQFPLAEGQPFFCMGQQGGNVSIWHWKADWQAAITAGQALAAAYPNMYVDYYPFTDEADDVLLAEYTDASYLPALDVGNLFANPMRATPVENLAAGGFGSLTARPPEAQDVQGHGVYADGRWRVIFSRHLAAAAEDDISFTTDQVYSVALAAWDGANDERNGAKSTSQWVSFQFGPAVAAAAPAVAAAPATAAPAQAREGIPPLVFLIIFAGVTIAVAFFYFYYRVGAEMSE
jgi:hypothetical protein